MEATIQIWLTFDGGVPGVAASGGCTAGAASGTTAGATAAVGLGAAGGPGGAAFGGVVGGAAPAGVARGAAADAVAGAAGMLVGEQDPRGGAAAHMDRKPGVRSTTARWQKLQGVSDGAVLVVEGLSGSSGAVDLEAVPIADVLKSVWPGLSSQCR